MYIKVSPENYGGGEKEEEVSPENYGNITNPYSKGFYPFGTNVAAK